MPGGCLSSKNTTGRQGLSDMKGLSDKYKAMQVDGGTDYVGLKIAGSALTLTPSARCSPKGNDFHCAPG